MEAVAVLRIARFVSDSFSLYDPAGEVKVPDPDEWFLQRGFPYPNLWVRDHWTEVLNCLVDLKLEIDVRKGRISEKIAALSWMERHVFTDELESLQYRLRNLDRLATAFSLTEV